MVAFGKLGIDMVKSRSFVIHFYLFTSSVVSWIYNGYMKFSRVSRNLCWSVRIYVTMTSSFVCVFIVINSRHVFGLDAVLGIHGLVKICVYLLLYTYFIKLEAGTDNLGKWILYLRPYSYSLLKKGSRNNLENKIKEYGVTSRVI